MQLTFNNRLLLLITWYIFGRKSNAPVSPVVISNPNIFTRYTVFL